MKTNEKAAALFAFCLFTFAFCTVDPKRLDGSWRAFEFSKNGSAQAVALDEIRLDLEAEKSRYAFSSLFKYREAGRFRTARGRLFLTDTTAAPPVERKIDIEKATADELWIETAPGELLKLRRATLSRDSIAKK